MREIWLLCFMFTFRCYVWGWGFQCFHGTKESREKLGAGLFNPGPVVVFDCHPIGFLCKNISTGFIIRKWVLGRVWPFRNSMCLKRHDNLGRRTADANNRPFQAHSRGFESSKPDCLPPFRSLRGRDLVTDSIPFALNHALLRTMRNLL